MLTALVITLALTSGAVLCYARGRIDEREELKESDFILRLNIERLEQKQRDKKQQPPILKGL